MTSFIWPISWWRLVTYTVRTRLFCSMMLSRWDELVAHSVDSLSTRNAGNSIASCNWLHRNMHFVSFVRNLPVSDWRLWRAQAPVPVNTGLGWRAGSKLNNWIVFVAMIYVLQPVCCSSSSSSSMVITFKSAIVGKIPPVILGRKSETGLSQRYL